MIPLRTSHVTFYTLVVTVTVAATVACGFWFIRRQMLTGNDFLLDAESKEILARVAPIEPPLDAEKVEAALKEHTKNDEDLFYFQLHEPAGKIIYHSPNLGEQALTDLTGGLDKRTLDIPPLGLLRVAEYHTPMVHVQIAMSLRNFQEVNEAFVRVFLLGLPLLAVMSFAFGSALRHSTLRPVREMQSTARRITANNLSERIPIPPGDSEMAALARLLNETFERLEKSFNHAKRFTADTSHELMTPLSIIRLHTEKLLSDPDLAPKNRHSVEEQLQETLHLTDTLERLLMLAKADSSVLSLKLQPVNVHEFIRQFVEDAKLLAESRGLHLKAGQTDNATATFDPGLLRQVLFNLLSNALRFSPAAGNVNLRSEVSNDRWTLEVSDEGPGVPGDRLDNIFGRFVQITPRSDPGSGAGLGLAICKSIIELHGGSIAARNRTDRSGLVISFQLPMQR